MDWVRTSTLDFCKGMGHIVLAGTLIVAFLTEIKVGTGDALEATALDCLLLATVANDPAVYNLTLAINAFRATILARAGSIKSFTMIAMMYF